MNNNIGIPRPKIPMNTSNKMGEGRAPLSKGTWGPTGDSEAERKGAVAPIRICDGNISNFNHMSS